ncbi:hypothetical protein VTN49DRAFT_6054 [Thermomyces lanuginosus]|uniref:uncharacterized protein n=1 Tax=Thermomyces lanuginosus TaxID=5541 RepID=UPI003742A869
MSMDEEFPSEEEHKARRSPPILEPRTFREEESHTNHTDATAPPVPGKVHPAFFSTLQYLASPLVPLVSITTGLPHPDFPVSILAFHLLTHEQLDSMARHYHQVWPPVPETFGYPVHIPAWVGTPNEHTVDLETKRRRIGRFIGLRGCESPVKTGFGIEDDPQNNVDVELEERMEREWQDALRRAQQEDDDKLLRHKAGHY